MQFAEFQETGVGEDDDRRRYWRQRAAGRGRVPVPGERPSRRQRRSESDLVGDLTEHRPDLASSELRDPV